MLHYQYLHTENCVKIVSKYHLVSISMSQKSEQSLFHKRFHVFIIYPNFALHKNYAFYYTSSFCRLFIASAECNSFCVCTKIKNKLYTMRNLLIGYCMKDSKSKMLGKKSMTSYISTQRYCYIYFSFVNFGVY